MDEQNPIPQNGAPASPVALERTGPPPIVRVGLLGATAAAIVAVGLLAAAMTASPGGILAADTSAGNGATTNVEDHGGGPGFGGITITAISGNDISLKTSDGWTRTISVDSGTTYSKADATIALSALKVGDTIGFRQTLEADGTYTIDEVVVVLPHLGGQVTAISGSTITVTTRDGSTGTITVDANTTYSVNGTDGKALSDITVGMYVSAEGTSTGDLTLTAISVRAGDQGFGRGGHHGFPGAPDDTGNGGSTTPDASTAPDATGTDAG